MSQILHMQDASAGELRVAVASRFARRLSDAMRAAGCAPGSYQGHEMLAQRLRWATQTVTHLLMGAVLPTMEQLCELSAELKINPRFWLDENDPPIPNAAPYVRPLDGPGPILFTVDRPPKAWSITPTTRMVSYLARGSMGWGVEGGDRIVATESIPACGPVRGLLYLFNNDDLYSLRLCTSADQGAIFRSAEDTDNPLIGGMGGGGTEDFSAGLVVAVIRSGEILHHAAYEDWKERHPEHARIRREK